MSREDRQWTGRTDGAGWMHRALIGLMKVLPMPVMYFLMALVVPFYLLFNHKGYLAIYHYLRRRQGWSVWRSFWGCCGNHFLFGASLMDRFAAFAGKKFEMDIPEYYLFTDLAAGEDGFLLLASHIGNPELCGYMLCSDRKRMNAVSFAGEKSSVQESRSHLLGENNIRLIEAGEGMEWLFTLNAALSDGEIVGIHADRVFGSPKTLTVTLLGAPAQIPLGPFSMAASRDLPVLAAFSLKTGLKRYHASIFRLDTPQMEGLSRPEKMQALADKYALSVETVLKQWPLQWYNFYEFWNE